MYMSAVVVGIERGHCRHRQAARAKVGDNVVQILDAITCRGSWGYAGPWRARRVALIRPAVLVPPRRHEDDLVDGVGVEKAKHRVKVRTRQHVGVFLGEVAPAAAAVWLIADRNRRAHLSPDRPSKILLAQVGTLSFSHPLFGVSVLFIYLSLIAFDGRLLRATSQMFLPCID